MHLVKLTMPALLISALVFSDPAAAQQRGRDGAQARDQNRSRGMQQARQGRTESEQGRVLRSKKVAVRDLGVEHLVVLLETDRGRTRIVDLGPVQNLRNLRIATGDTLAVSGNTVMIGDRRVLMARNVRAGDRQARIQRGRRSDSQGRRQQMAFRGTQQDFPSAQRSGRVARTKKVGIRGTNLEHLVVLLETQSGRRVVDLGPVRNLRDLRITSGDRIAVAGEVVRIGDRQVLMAERLQTDGRTVRIDRRAPRRGQQQNGQQARRQQQREQQGRQQNRSRSSGRQGQRQGSENT